MSRSRFYEEIRYAKVEREVEAVYNKGIAEYFTKNTNIQIQHPHACDGLIEKVLENMMLPYLFQQNTANTRSAARNSIDAFFLSESSTVLPK